MHKLMIRMGALVVFTGLSSGIAAAQVPTAGNVYFGYTYYNTNLTLNRGSLTGWEGSLEGKLAPFLGIVADLTGHYGTLDFPNATGTCVIGGTCPPISASAHVYEALFGPRVSVPIGRFRPFGELEVGVAHVNTNGFGSSTSYGTAVGGGLDYRIFRPLAWRFEGDYVRTHLFSTSQNNLRLSTGIVLRF